MSAEFESYLGGTASVVSYGGNQNPAVQAMMAAMFAVPESPALGVANANEAALQAVSGIAKAGIELG
jgi:hypothetical protein